MSIKLERLFKSYDDRTVVNAVSFEVADGECFVLLGPSGSGKSTVLRIVAGLARADAGRVVLHGRDVTGVPPQRRGVGFVFQNYALFGHLTVAQNIEFPLRVRKLARAERRRRRAELLDVVDLVGLDDRFPDQLSGGQQQRVALARALAHRPDLLLLDEPFGALDARIRLELRRTLRRIQRELGVTSIFVTHDQEEAFELADRLGVMNFGRLLEVGPPRELYLRPRTEFVATFLGKANLLVGSCSGGSVDLGAARFPLSGIGDQGDSRPRRVQVLFRPEDVAVKLTPEALEWPRLGEARVDEVDFSGSYERLRLRLPRLNGARSIAPTSAFGSDFVAIDAIRSQHVARRYPLRPGDRAWVGVRRVHALAHPGLSLLLLDDGSAAAADGLAFAAELGRRCHGRLTVAVAGAGRADDDPRLRDVRERVGGGLAGIELRPTIDADADGLSCVADAQPCDVLIVPAARRDWVDPLLSRGEHHLLLVPRGARLPRRALICVAAGEQAKADVLFAGRLLRHLDAEATVLTSLDHADEAAVESTRRFHRAALSTLALLGVPARQRLAAEPPDVAAAGELARDGHDLLVIGAHVPADGRPLVLGGLGERLIDTAGDRAVLLVRTARAPR